MESHLQSAVRIHLDLTVVKLNEANENLGHTQSKLDHTESKFADTALKLEETRYKLDETATELSNTKIQLINTTKTTDVLKKELETLQREFEEKMVMVKRESSDFPSMFIWKIDEFSKHLREAKAGEKTLVESAPFYTEKYGYKMNVRIRPNGSPAAKGKYLSVYICVMGGQYDAILPWPFKRKVKFTLIDQQEDTDKSINVFEEIIPDNDPECYARPKTKYNSSAHGIPSFISHTKLESRRYVLNDTLFIQVEVGPPLEP